jgi:hypothetical protein
MIADRDELTSHRPFLCVVPYALFLFLCRQLGSTWWCSYGALEQEE